MLAPVDLGNLFTVILFALFFIPVIGQQFLAGRRSLALAPAQRAVRAAPRAAERPATAFSQGLVP